MAPGKGEQTKARIIEQSAALFNRQGYAGASMSDIMAATGLQKGGIYRHFEGKDDLALQTFDYSIELVTSRYRDALRSERNAIARLMAILHTFRELEKGTPIAGGCPMMNTAIESDDTHPALRARAQQAMDEWRATLVYVVEAGMRRGEVRATVDPEMVATMMIATLEGGLMLSRLYGDSRYADQVTAYLENYLRRDVKA